jgi:hypothetical protein
MRVGLVIRLMVVLGLAVALAGPVGRHQALAAGLAEAFARKHR